MTTLPHPPQALTTWGDFISLLWAWGRENCPESALRPWIDHAHKEMTREREDGPAIRPSGNLNCAMKTYLRLKGVPDEETPSWLAMTFNIGHLLHAHSYAFVEAALPPGFSAQYEHRVDLTGFPGWPGPDTARQEGTADMVIEVTDAELAGDYLEVAALPPRCLVDFKTMSDWSYKQHRNPKKGPEDKPDSFGYLSQLAVYREVLGAAETGAVLAGMNRNNLRAGPGGMGLVARDISSAYLDEEAKRVTERLTDPQPRPELLGVWGREADFPCNAVKGTCSDRVRCSEFRTGLEV